MQEHCGEDMGDRSCTLPPMELAGPCILHTSKDKDPAALREAILRLDAEAAAAGRSLDLSALRSGGLDLRNVRFASDVVLHRARFSGPLLCGGARFRRLDMTGAVFDGREATAEFTECAFEDDASFYGTTFGGVAEFTDAVFMGKAEFERALFRGNASFWSARFDSPDRPAAFKDAAFEGAAKFEMARFGGVASFADTRFLAERKDVIFTAAKALGPFSFVRAEFHGPTYFNFAEFHANVTFERVLIAGIVQFKKAQFHGYAFFQDLRLVPGPLFQQGHVSLDFRYVVIRQQSGVRFLAYDPDEKLDLSRVRFAQTDTSNVRFMNVRWERQPASRVGFLRSLAGGDGEIGVRACDERFLATTPTARLPARPPPPSGDALAGDHGSISDPHYDPLEAIRHETGEPMRHEHGAALYKGLREAYARSSMYAEAGEFHVREMEMRRLGAGEARGWRGFVRRNMSFLNLYRAVSRYGESYHRPGIWIGVVFVLFAGIHLLDGEPVLDAAWRSFIGFFQLQIKTGSRIDFVEGLVGLPLLAFFGLALRRQFKR